MTTNNSIFVRLCFYVLEIFLATTTDFDIHLIIYYKSVHLKQEFIAI